MKTIFALVLFTLATAVFAHPNGTYMLNGDREVTVTMQKLNKCVVSAGALTGYIRSFKFSPKAEAHPYAFVSGLYVEIHEGAKEIYVQVTENCVPKAQGTRYEASHETFDVYSIEKLN